MLAWVMSIMHVCAATDVQVYMLNKPVRYVACIELQTESYTDMLSDSKVLLIACSIASQHIHQICTFIG